MSTSSDTLYLSTTHPPTRSLTTGYLKDRFDGHSTVDSDSKGQPHSNVYLIVMIVSNTETVTIKCA